MLVGNRTLVVGLSILFASGTLTATPCQTSQSNALLTSLGKSEAADWTAAGGTPEDWAERGRKSATRAAQVRKIEADGGVCTPDDLYNAASIYRHTGVITDLVKAIKLSAAATQVSPSSEEAKNLFASSMDELLVRAGGKQIYGTLEGKDGKPLPTLLLLQK
jgi:hypothetical protein